MSFRMLPVAIVVGLLFAPSLAQSADRTRTLLPYVPESANVVGVIHVEDILNGRRARKEDWANKQKDKFLAGAAVIPPWASTCVFAARVQLEIPREEWNVLLLAMPNTVTIDQIAAHEKGQVETLAGIPVVRAQRDAYFAALAPGVIAARSPAMRSDVARWIRSTANATAPQITPYLREAASSPSHIVLAVDLQDSVDPDRARQRLSEMRDAKLEQKDIDALVALAQSLQGLTLEIEVGNTTTAELTVDFGNPVGDYGKLAGNIALDAVRHHGLDLPELAQAKLQSNEKSIVIDVTLSDASLRKILSLMVSPNPTMPSDQPPPAATTQTTTTTTSTQSDQPNVAASKSYFAAVDQALRDVERPSWSNQSTGTESWLERYANKIDQLSISGVDPDLVSYGASVSSKLRGLAASLRGQDVDVQAQENTITYNTQYDPGWSYLGWWGAVGYRPPSYNVTSNLQEVREKQAAAVTAGTDNREQIWQMIDNERNQIRGKMQQKYGSDFTGN